MYPLTSLKAFVTLMLSLVAPSIALAATQPDDTQRRFEVWDSIEIARFVEAGGLSPDGKWLVAVTQRGVLPLGVAEAQSIGSVTQPSRG